jgi:hypothetical protein
MDETHKKEDDLSRANLDMHTNIININIKSMNNIIFVVSTGVFVLSLSLIHYIERPVVYPKLVVFSWLAIFLVMILNFFALWLMVRYSQRQKEITNQWRVNNFSNPSEYNSDIINDKELKALEKDMKWTNKIVFILLPSGIFTLILFTIVNFLNHV